MRKYKTGIPWWALLNFILFVSLGVAFIAFLDSFPSSKNLWIILIVVSLVWGVIAGGIFAVGLFNSLGTKGTRVVDKRYTQEVTIEIHNERVRDLNDSCPVRGRDNPGVRK